VSLFMSAEDAAEWSESIGEVVSGVTRQIVLAVQRGVPAELGLDPGEWRLKYLPGYRVPRLELREAAKELTEQGLTHREAGAVLGVNHTTVGRAIQPEPDSGANAPEPQPDPGFPQVDESPLWEGPDSGANAPEPQPAPPAPKSTRDLLAQSDQNDWRTPRKFLVAAHAVLGGIDLDPATSAEANETVEAAQFYTEEDDGLAQPWKGRVWLNPPYGGQARLFVERLVREYEVGNVTAGITLVNSHPTETAWFQQLFRYAICFVRGRIDFGGPSREVSTNSTHGSALAYLGQDTEAFAARFSEFGAVVRRV
jgi:phage N-6-adenine-methyltransferase